MPYEVGYFIIAMLVDRNLLKTSFVRWNQESLRDRCAVFIHTTHTDFWKRRTAVIAFLLMISIGGWFFPNSDSPSGSQTLAGETNVRTVAKRAHLADGAALSSLEISQPTDLPNNDGAIEPGRASSMIASRGLPIRPIQVDSNFGALQVFSWDESGVHRLTLDGWVRIQIGTYIFNAKRAAIWVNRRPGVIDDPNDPDNKQPIAATINEIAVYLEGLSAADQPSGVNMTGNDLLITTTTIGSVSLKSDSFREGRPAHRDEFLQRGEVRFVDWMQRRVRAGGGGAETSGERIVVDRPKPVRHEPIDRPTLEQYLNKQANAGNRLPGAKGAGGEEGQKKGAPAGGEQGGARTQTGGYWTGGTEKSPFGATLRPPSTVFFRADDLAYQFSQDGKEGFATLRGNLVVNYSESGRRPGEARPRQLTLTADRAVIFTDPISIEDLQTQQIDADNVRGVYLEGNVSATDGEITMRGPHLYYEFSTNRAIVLDAVLHTYNKEAKVPVYVRADEIRQIASNEWKARDVTISTSEFFTPTVSLGASKITIRRNTDAKTGETRNDITVKNATARLGDLPFFWWPYYRGAAEEFPLRKLTVGGNSRNGLTVKTEWDLFALAGMDRPSRMDASLLVDYYAERGPAFGGDIEYQTKHGRGRLTGYFLNEDNGTDKFSSGAEIDRDGESRGMLIGWHRQDLGDNWTLLLEGAYVSDEAFMDNFFDGMTETGREFQTRAYLLNQSDNTQLEITAKTALNDFLINEDLLQAQGYQVEKLPELGYYRFADELLGGKVSYSSEYRLSRLRLRFPDHTLAAIGQGRSAFGLPPSTNLRDFFFASGLRDTFTNRFFTRQEVSVPWRWGAVNVVPFMSGRFAFYDDDEPFRRFDSQAEDSWWMVTTGIRFSTQFSKTNNAVDNRFFDLHRIRHIIEPSLVVWHSESNADGSNFPVFDLEVEGASAGSAARFGLRNTWQTMRGGAGRWHSVDVLVVNTNVLFAGQETQDQFSIPRFFAFRPEYSRLGDHFQGDFNWLVSDSFAVSGDSVLDLNNGGLSRANVGFRIDHAANLFTFADYRFYNFNNDNLVGLGVGYTLTPTYRFRLATSFDINESESRNLSFALEKKTPQFDIGLTANYDNERQETTVGLVFSPKGTGGRTYGGLLNPRDANR